jgi:hypothetical protein
VRPQQSAFRNSERQYYHHRPEPSTWALLAMGARCVASVSSMPLILAAWPIRWANRRR